MIVYFGKYKIKIAFHSIGFEALFMKFNYTMSNKFIGLPIYK